MEVAQTNGYVDSIVLVTLVGAGRREENWTGTFPLPRFPLAPCVSPKQVTPV